MRLSQSFKSRLIIVNPGQVGADTVCIDLYGIDIPHPWLFATTRRRRSCQWVTFVSKLTPWESVVRAFISHTSSIIRLTVTTNRRKSQQGKHVFKYSYLQNKYVYKYDYILKDSNSRTFSSWFLISKNYVLQRKNTGFFYNYNHLWTHQHYCWPFKIHASQVISKVRIS